MKRHPALLAVLGLFLFSIVNPSLYLDSCTRGIELNETPFFAAADGDESGESITSFSETLADDVLFYPDAFPSDASASAGAYTETQGNTYAATSSKDDVFWTVYDYTAPYTVYLNLTFTLPTGGILESGKLSTYILARDKDANFITYDILFYDWTNSEWDVIDSEVGGAGSYQYNTVYSQDYLGGDSFKCSVTPHDPAEVEPIIYWDWALVDFEIMTLADSEHYAESFADVSDWTASVGNAPDSDGDRLEWPVLGDNAYDKIWSNGPSITNIKNYYYEFTAWANITAGEVRFQLYGYSADGAAASSYLIANIVDLPDSARTYKGIITQDSACESIAILSKSTTTDVEVYSDYLRIAPADEMSWQHDGSTTAGIDDDGIASVAYSYSSDGDIVTLNATKTDTVVDNPDIYFRFDMTTTAADVERDYYQFLKFEVVDIRTSGTMSLTYGFYGDGFKVTPQPLEIGVTCINILSTTAATSEHWMLWISGVECWTTGESFEVDIDFVKACSIANYTVTQSGVTTDDYLYVDSGVLHSNIDDGYIELNHDPALSVSDTYPVYNLTTSGTAPQFSQYVSEWSTYSDDMRGATTSGTVTDIKLKFDSTEILSAIKFIEDGTAPDILDKFVTPIIPDDDESVTITAVTYDTIEVYEVIINAVVYPAGFSDVDYDLTEQTEGVLWSYEFSTLTAGYYLFQVTANDGANTYSEYIPVTVRVSTIEITTYTFFGAGSDFSYMQYSGYINRDCTYNISEWSDSWAKNETHTGSVTEGMFNIAWDKIGVDDLNANFTIVFLNGSLSLTIEGYYGTAYKLLRITEIEFENVEESQAVTNITVNFYTNKDIDWFVYDRDDSDAVLASGSSLEGMDSLIWLKDTTPHVHKYAIKWTDGVSNIWINGSYWTYKENLDSLDQPGADWEARDTRRTIEFWTTLGAFVAVAGIIAIGIGYYKLNKKIGNLPNYQTQ